ncbi:MAG TPA: PAS domain-containing protein [Kofleriaceae bacterium]|nr:PAS domain-containing protein [Kofleriaceae bacterium]
MADDGTSTPLVKRLRDGLRLVSTVTQAFAETTSDYPRLLEVIACDIAEAIPDTCVVNLVSGDTITLVAIHEAVPEGAPRLRYVLDQAYPLRMAGLSAEVLARGPLFMPRIDFDALRARMSPEALDQLRRIDTTGLLVVPLATRGELLGVLWIIRRGNHQPLLDELDLEIVQDLANHAALAILNARLFQRLEHSERLRAAEERAVQASSLLDAIVENIPDMVFVKDAATLSFVRFNRAGEQLLGLSRDQLLGKTDFDLFPASEAAFFTTKDRETLSATRMVDIPEEPIQTPRGTRWLHTKKVPLLDATGRAAYLLGISHDITERKLAIAELSAAKSAAEDANRELESFSYSVAHDLRTPLRAIDGFSQALTEDYGEQLDSEGRRYLSRVRQSAQRMAGLIDDLLTLSRVTRSELRRTRVDLSALAHTVIATLQRLEPERRVEIVIAPGLVVDADPQLTTIALDNLLGNAWKFTSKRSNARIELGQAERNGVPAFFVRDNGAGFDMAYRDKLFGVFQRLHPESEFPGTGIGLATVARITQRHRGRIWAEGRPGAGATFYFTLMEYPCMIA